MEKVGWGAGDTQNTLCRLCGGRGLCPRGGTRLRLDVWADRGAGHPRPTLQEVSDDEEEEAKEEKEGEVEEVKPEDEAKD